MCTFEYAGCHKTPVLLVSLAFISILCRENPRKVPARFPQEEIGRAHV